MGSGEHKERDDLMMTSEMAADARVASIKIYVLISALSAHDCHLSHQIGTGGQGRGTYNKAENENPINGPDQDEMKALKKQPLLIPKSSQILTFCLCLIQTQKVP